ncbi:conserved Plasmodium protein, unknown function [Plasmodium gallinaceum]|uniref:Uncharacterized protein n=1 Tax=Plasmodium gallinaceum TaxID=5849 RepID=A0A1J1GUK8_PLAGA|nr:conserved Plasmodium protein, unknown function [Plasmodium gallinaceum]CRG96165.1 conserved Plasmodium protein, unknown function [Plasmodium gallinaceum]
MKKRKNNSKVQVLERSFRRKGKIKTIYEKHDDLEFINIIDKNINYIWNYINNIDDIVNDDEFLKEEIKEKIEKKKNVKQIDDYDEIIYYNKNLSNQINIQKIRKALYHFNIKVNIDDIIKMFLYYTNNDYFKKIIKNDIYSNDYIEKKKDDKKFNSLNINNLYINYEMFKYIFLHIDLNIESNGKIW